VYAPNGCRLPDDFLSAAAPPLLAWIFACRSGDQEWKGTIETRAGKRIRYEERVASLRQCGHLSKKDIAFIMAGWNVGALPAQITFKDMVLAAIEAGFKRGHLRCWPDQIIPELACAHKEPVPKPPLMLEYTPEAPLAPVMDALGRLDKKERHAAVRAALTENPDRSQASLVKECKVHPDTVRRCRRELEEAGAIPVLPHRHGPVQASRRRVNLEAADD
jgi:hypothetical protein